MTREDHEATSGGAQAGSMLIRFFRTLTQTRAETEVGDFTKRPDTNSVVWMSRYVGRWGIGIRTHYVGDRYGHIGSDSTEVTFTLTRDRRPSRTRAAGAS